MNEFNFAHSIVKYSVRIGENKQVAYDVITTIRNREAKKELGFKMSEPDGLLMEYSLSRDEVVLSTRTAKYSSTLKKEVCETICAN